LKRFARVFISNGKKGKESWIVERTRERACLGDAHCGKRKIASAIKLTIREKHVMEICD
jgi:hypothetical protein